MPTPEQWTEQDFESAKALRDSGKGSAAQRARLENALNAYWTAKTGNLGIAGDGAAPKISRETPSDPIAAYDAETQRMSAGAEGPRPQQGQTPPGKLETFGNSAINAMNLGMGDSLAAAEGINALGGDIGQLESVKGQIASRRAEGKRANPFSAGAGELVGLAASPAMAAIGPMGGALGAAGLTGRAARIAGGLGSGAAQGAAGGAALAPEGAKGEGAMMGGALGGVLGGGLAAISGDAGAITGKANELTARAAGPEKSDIQQILLNKGSDGLKELGARINQTGIRTIPDAEQAIEQSGAMIGQLSGMAKSKVDLTEAGGALMDDAEKLLKMRNPQAQALGQQIKDQAEPLLGHWEEFKITNSHPFSIFDEPFAGARGGPNNAPFFRGTPGNDNHTSGIIRSSTGKPFVVSTRPGTGGPTGVQAGSTKSPFQYPDSTLEATHQAARQWVPDPNVSYAEAHELRKFLDELVQKASEMGQKDTPLANRLRHGANKIRAAMDNAAAQEGPEFHAAMRDANLRFSTAKQVLEYKTGQLAGDMTGDIPVSNVLTAGLRNGKRRARVLAGTARTLSKMGGALPELAPMAGGAIGRFATPDEEMQ